MLNSDQFNMPSSEINYAAQLQLYQQKIANILESFTDAFFEVDKAWTVTYWNKEAEQLMGMSRADILGKNLWSVYQEAISLRFYTEYDRAMKENVSVRFEEYFAPLNLWVEVAAFPSGDSLSVYFKDITARKHASDLLETEKQKYQDLFNFSPIPQWVYDFETLVFLQVNEAAVTTYGYSKEEFLKMTIRDIRHPEEQSALNEIISTVQIGTYNQSAVKHLKKNGEEIFCTLGAANTLSSHSFNR
jgi:PAS domain S-box-containing protein